MSFTIEAVITDKIGFASHQNAAPVIRQLAIRSANEATLENCHLKLASDPAFLSEKVWRLDRILPESELVVSDRDVHLNGTLLSGLSEALSASITLTLTDGEGQELATLRQPVELLAHNEWGGVGSMADLIPAFVMPNDPAVDRVLKAASDALRRAGKPDAINGYESKERTRVWQLDANTADGLRLCLAAEFASIHVFHLRGNARTSGERRRMERDNVFGQGTRTPVAIALLVKNPEAAQHGQIHFHDIGDYLTQAEKLAIIARFGSIDGITKAKGWQTITPDEHGDWLGQRDSAFDAYLPLGGNGAEGRELFSIRSRGVTTSRDAWCYNPSKADLIKNVSRSIVFYNSQIDLWDSAKNPADIENFVEVYLSKFSWGGDIFKNFTTGRKLDVENGSVIASLYRPFTHQWLYRHQVLNNRIYQMLKFYPKGNEPNKAIMLSGVGARDFSALMVNETPCLDAIEKGQCFPRYLYDGEAEPAGDDPQAGLFAAAPAAKGGRRDAITDEGLAHFQAAYPGEAITKDDLFHYTYGLLHSEDYRARFADNLSKQLPRIPAVKKGEDFWAFVEAGRRLGDLHCDFDSAPPFPVTIAQGDLRLAHIPDPVKYYRVEKMKFGGKRPNTDKTTVIYNANITITGIPLAAYDYMVNGKPALEWVMERQCVKVDKASGIENDANRYANETVGDPAYPLLLFQRVISVSLETMEIVNGLPKLEIG